MFLTQHSLCSTVQRPSVPNFQCLLLPLVPFRGRHSSFCKSDEKSNFQDKSGGTRKTARPLQINTVQVEGWDHLEGAAGSVWWCMLLETSLSLKAGPRLAKGTRRNPVSKTKTTKHVQPGLGLAQLVEFLPLKPEGLTSILRTHVKETWVWRHEYIITELSKERQEGLWSLLTSAW